MFGSWDQPFKFLLVNGTVADPKETFYQTKHQTTTFAEKQYLKCHNLNKMIKTLQHCTDAMNAIILCSRCLVNQRDAT